MSPDANRRPVHLWIVAILSLIWNAFGAFDYLATELRMESYLSQFTPEQLAYFKSFPSWAIAAWAFGVWGAVAGSVGLLLARRWAIWAFALSIAGLAITSLYQFVLTDGAAMMGSVGATMTVMIWIVAIALLWYSVRQRDRGVLR